MKGKKRGSRKIEITHMKINELQLLAESGGELIRVEDLPEEVAQAVSKQIRIFQQKQENAVSKTLYDLIGRPDIKPIESLTEEKLTNALESLIEKLARKKIHFEVISNVSTEQRYQFLVDNLDRIQILDLGLRGWKTHLFYEDFQPEPENALKLSAYNLFASLFNQSQVVPDQLFSDTVILNGNSMNQNELIKILDQCKASLNDGRFLNMNVRYCEFSEDQKCLVADVEFDYRISRNRKRTSFSNSSRLEFDNSTGASLIAAIELPVLSEESGSGRLKKKRG